MNTKTTIYWAVFVAFAVAAFGTILTYSQVGVPVAEKISYQPATQAGQVAGVTTTLEEAEIAAERSTVNLLFTMSDGSTLTATSTLASGSSVLDFTMDGAVRGGLAIDLETSGLGTLVTAIGGDVNGTDNAYWTYTVNGEFADVGADAYIPASGDRIAWSFIAL